MRLLYQKPLPLAATVTAGPFGSNSSGFGLGTIGGSGGPAAAPASGAGAPNGSGGNSRPRVASDSSQSSEGPGDMRGEDSDGFDEVKNGVGRRYSHGIRAVYRTQACQCLASQTSEDKDLHSVQQFFFHVATVAMRRSSEGPCHMRSEVYHGFDDVSSMLVTMA